MTIKDVQWDKGSVVVLVRSAIWFISATKQICVPLNDVAVIELTKRDVQGKPADLVIKIDHLESGEVTSRLCSLPSITDAPGSV